MYGCLQEPDDLPFIHRSIHTAIGSTIVLYIIGEFFLNFNIHYPHQRFDSATLTWTPSCSLISSACSSAYFFNL